MSTVTFTWLTSFSARPDSAKGTSGTQSDQPSWDFSELYQRQTADKTKPPHPTSINTHPQHWSDPVLLDHWIKQYSRTEGKEDKPDKAKKRQRQRGK